MSLKWKKWMAGFLAAAMLLSESPLAVAAESKEAKDSVYAVTATSIKDVTGKVAVFDYGTWGYNIGKDVSGNLVMTTKITKAATPNTVINSLGKDATAGILDSIYAVSGNTYTSGNNAGSVSGGNTGTSKPSTTSGNNVVTERPVMSYLWSFSVGRSDGTSVKTQFGSAAWKNYNFVQSIFNADGTNAKTDSKGYLAPGEYIARFSNGKASTDVKFSVQDPNVDFAITGQPADVKADTKTAVSFQVKTSKTNLTYQWQKSTDGGKNWVNATSTSAKTATLTLTTAIALDGMLVRCVVSNAKGGKLISNTAKLTVNAPAGPAVESITKNVSAVAGETVKLEVEATGTGLTYQWQKSDDGGKTWSNSASTGAKTAKLSMTAKLSFDGMIFRCIISDSYGRKVTAGPMTLVVKAAIAIESTSCPSSVAVGSKAVFAVEAIGTNLTYQWQKSSDGGKTWANSGSTGATTNTLSLATKISYNGWKFRCLISDSKGNKLTAGPFTLNVKSSGVATVATQPVDVSANVGDNVEFSVKATGDGLKYQWQKSSNGTDWSNSSSTGAKTAKISLSAKASFNGMKFRCVVTDVNGKTATSKAATLTVKSTEAKAVEITSSPSNQSVKVGDPVNFKVAASGTGLTYQWQKSTDGSTWVNSGSTGATTDTLSMTAKISFNGLQFRCVVTDANGKKATSKAATLSVEAKSTIEIKGQPSNASANAGDMVVFGVMASGEDLTYQWQKSTDGGNTWVNSGSTGATTYSMMLAAKVSYNGFQFRCKITDKSGNSVTTKAVTLTVQ